MKCLLSVCICAVFLLSGCITGRNPLSEIFTSKISKAGQKTTSAAAKADKVVRPRKSVAEGTREVGPVSASFSDTAHLDRF